MDQPSRDAPLDLDYPCEWSYRVIGRDDLALRSAIATVVGAHDYAVTECHVSRGGRFRSINVLVVVASEEQRRTIFHALVQHSDVDYVL